MGPRAYFRGACDGGYGTCRGRAHWHCGYPHGTPEIEAESHRQRKERGLVMHESRRAYANDWTWSRQASFVSRRRRLCLGFTVIVTGKTLLLLLCPAKRLIKDVCMSNSSSRKNGHGVRDILRAADDDGAPLMPRA